MLGSKLSSLVAESQDLKPIQLVSQCWSSCDDGYKAWLMQVIAWLHPTFSSISGDTLPSLSTSELICKRIWHYHFYLLVKEKHLCLSWNTRKMFCHTLEEAQESEEAVLGYKESIFWEINSIECIETFIWVCRSLTISLINWGRVISLHIMVL